jgi:capsular polysaccharide biosynthesis protein
MRGRHRSFTLREADMEMNALYRQGMLELAANPVEAIRTLDQVDVVGAWGLPVKDGQPSFEPHDGFGWSEEHINHVLADPRSSRNATTTLGAHGSGLLLSFPGAFTFGHWIVDILQRLELAASRFDLTDLAILVPGPLPPWTLPFLEMFDLSTDQLVPLIESETLHVPTLIVPSLSRRSDFLPEFPHRQAFERARHWLEAKRTVAAERSEVAGILVAHEPQTSVNLRSSLSNFSAVRRALEPLGFDVFAPLGTSLCHQAETFARSHTIVGEDSSALHNVIFCNGTRLVVINSALRKNLLHLSLAKLSDSDCSYVFCEEDSAGRYFCDPAALEEVVNLATK